MPIRQIQVSEYECFRCGYKWTNRVNGKDGKIPKYCAMCKSRYWNGKGEGGYNPITPRERSLRVCLYKYEGYRDVFMGIVGRQYRPNELCKKFLSLNPRPTIKELYEALFPLGYDTYKNRYRHLIPDPDRNRPKTEGRTNLKVDDSGWIPDHENPNQVIWNRDPNFKSDWVKALEEETRLRRQVMKRVIESRGEEVPKEKTLKELDDAQKERIEELMPDWLKEEEGK